MATEKEKGNDECWLLMWELELKLLVGMGSVGATLGNGLMGPHESCHPVDPLLFTVTQSLRKKPLNGGVGHLGSHFEETQSVRWRDMTTGPAHSGRGSPLCLLTLPGTRKQWGPVLELDYNPQGPLPSHLLPPASLHP